MPRREPDSLADAAGELDLLGLPSDETARRLAELDWDFVEQTPDAYTHALHPYPARFTPRLPRQAIAALSCPGEIVLDPFSGGGTTAVEAIAAARRAYSLDANPVGNAVGRAKTTPLTKADRSALHAFESELFGIKSSDLLDAEPRWLPGIPNQTLWYDDLVFHALGVVRGMVGDLEADGARGLATVAFIQAATRLSFQDSETRYASNPRKIDVIEVPRLVLAEVRRMKRITENCPAGNAVFIDGDARDPQSYNELPDGSVGLVITSPPYPNTYDYHLYHRFRLFWLGEDPKALRRIEIGSHLKNQSIAAPETAYLQDMRAVLDCCARVIAPGRWMLMVVGDGVFKGATFKTAQKLAPVAEDVGFDSVVVIDRRLPDNRRSVTKPGRRLVSEQIMLLRMPDRRRRHVVHPNYSLFPYERDLQLRELRELGGMPIAADDGQVSVVPTPKVNRAAFSHGIRREDGTAARSIQSLIEGVTDEPTRRKDSTYFAHSIHRFKGKFYPQLAKALINMSSLDPGDSLIADPFGGSGTVALEAAINGYDAVTIDCNPLATVIANAKTNLTSVAPDAVESAVERLIGGIQAAPSTLPAELGSFNAEVIDELESWFAAPVLRKLNYLLGAIRTEPNPALVSFFEVVASDILREVSQQEPKDLRIRRRVPPLEDAPVFDLFSRRLNAAATRVTRFLSLTRERALRTGNAVVVLGNSADPQVFSALGPRSVDAVVSSPPYAAALPYIDTDRLSLAAILGVPSRRRRGIEDVMIGSREISTSALRAQEAILDEAKSEDLPESTLVFLAQYRAAVEADKSAGFRRRQAPAVLLRYFALMSAVLANVKKHTVADAPCWFVIGDSRSTVGGKTWIIPTAKEIAAIATHRGCRVIEEISITVTREDILHSRNAITQNVILHVRA